MNLLVLLIQEVVEQVREKDIPVGLRGRCEGRVSYINKMIGADDVGRLPPRGARVGGCENLGDRRVHERGDIEIRLAFRERTVPAPHGIEIRRHIEPDETKSKLLLEIELRAETLEPGVHPDREPSGRKNVAHELFRGLIPLAVTDEEGDVVPVELARNV